MSTLFMFHVKPIGGGIESACDQFQLDTIKKIESSVLSTAKQLQSIKCAIAYHKRMTFFGETHSLCQQEMFKNVARIFSTLTVELHKNTGKHCTVEFYSSPIPVQYIKLEQLGDYIMASNKLTDTHCEIAWDRIANSRGNTPTLPGMETTLIHWTSIIGNPIVAIRGIRPANMPKGCSIYAFN